MTRKRFVKLLMSHGVSRNEANLSAAEVVTHGRSYEHEYLVFVCAKDFPDLADRFARVAERAMKMIVEAIPSWIEAIMCAAKAIADAIPQVIVEINQRQLENGTGTE